MLSIDPKYPQFSGRSFAIYVNGNVHVNSTMQLPISAHNAEFLGVTILGLEILNKAPAIPNFESLILAYPID